MGLISGFWVGARRWGTRIDLVRVARKAGGWEALYADAERWLVAEGMPRGQVDAWLNCPEEQSIGEVITLADERYPSLLAQLTHAPPVLSVLGQPTALTSRAIAVVGTRRCTSYGSSVARHLGGALAAAGVCVVSGLARGIDAHAHLGSLGLGRTVAVLGHGLRHMSPRTNARLRDRIIESGGAVLSAWSDRHEARPWTFPRRNRWIAGLSQAVVVVEAPIRSGAMITAREALELSRDVYAVPGPIGGASAGCVRLLRDGAGVVGDVDEFVADLTGLRAHRRDDWLNDLFSGDSVEQVARRYRYSTTELLAHLSTLEVAGEVVRMPGQRYAPGHAVY